MEIKEAIKYIDELIADEEEAIEEYSKKIGKFHKFPRILETLTILSQEELRHLEDLKWIRCQLMEDDNKDELKIANTYYGGILEEFGENKEKE